MHPARYFENVGPASLDLPKPVKHTKPFIIGAMGELETRILLEQYAGPDIAGELGPKLKGSNYRIDETRPGHRLTLVYASEWGDDDTASQYFDAYRKVLRGKWKRLEIADQSASRFSGKSEDGYFLVTRDGKRVLSEEGFAESLGSLPIPIHVDNVPREGSLRASGR
jgi:hypothetical protein